MLRSVLVSKLVSKLKFLGFESADQIEFLCVADDRFVSTLLEKKMQILQESISYTIELRLLQIACSLERMNPLSFKALDLKQIQMDDQVQFVIHELLRRDPMKA